MSDMKTAQAFSSPTVLVIGGAGFIGSNLVHVLAEQGRSVRVLDNLSRPGVSRNLEWLLRRHGSQIQVFENDVLHTRALRMALRGVDSVFHFAGQVAVTASMDDPMADLDTNVRGTLNVLEQVRALPHRPFFLFTSTNKVYGDLAQLPLTWRDTRYEPRDPGCRAAGLSEDLPLDFRTPYGCSKGAADSYVLDYARSFDMPNVVFRMSCIYGPRQFGTEDQGWVAHFLIQAMHDQAITVYGDGRQVRDLLMVTDLVEAFLAAEAHQSAVAGQAFNIGGGVRHAASVTEVLSEIGALLGRPPQVRTGPWRIADQKYYVSDTRRFEQSTGWHPQISVPEGLAALHRWLRDNRELLAVQRTPSEASVPPLRAVAAR